VVKFSLVCGIIPNKVVSTDRQCQMVEGPTQPLEFRLQPIEKVSNPINLPTFKCSCFQLWYKAHILCQYS